MGQSNGMNSYGAGMYWGAFAAPAPAALADITGGQNWTELTDCISMNGVPVERSVTDVTHLRSPSKAKEKVPGFADSGTNVFRINYAKGLLASVIALCPGTATAPDTAPTYGRLQWALVFPDNGVWVFTGFLKSLPVEVPEDNRPTVELTIEISGLPTFYAFA